MLIYRDHTRAIDVEVVWDVGQAELLHRPAAVVSVEVEGLKGIPCLVVGEACTGNHLYDNVKMLATATTSS